MGRLSFYTTILLIQTVSGIALSDSAKAVFSQQGQTAQLELSGQENWVYDVSKGSDGQTWTLVVPAISNESLKYLKEFRSSLIQSVDVDSSLNGKSKVTIKTASDKIDAFDYMTSEPNRLIVDFYSAEPESAKPQVAARKKTQKSAALLGTEKTSSPPAQTAKTDAKEDAKEVDGSRKPASDVLGIADPNGMLGLVVNETEEVEVPLAKKGNQGKKLSPELHREDKPKSSSGEIASQNSDKTSEDGNFDRDSDRFAIRPFEISEESILRSKDEYYISYPMIQLPLEAWEKIKVSENIYEIEAKDTEENKQARLLLTLFKNKRYLVYMKVLAWYREKFPESQYNEIIDFMTADVHFQLWENNKSENDKEKAFLTWDLAIQKFPKSALAEKTSLKLGFFTLEDGDGFNALRYFNNHINNPAFAEKSYSKDLARLGSALAMMKLNRTGDSLKLLEDLETQSKYKEIVTEASFRKGDAYIQKKDFEMAAQEFRNSQKKYPQAVGTFPNAMYNQAESLFAVRKYKDSLEQYRNFLKNFPKSDHAAFAMTRVGELLGILGADKNRVTGTFMETVFRFGEKPSANIAQMRLVTEKMKTAREREFKPLLQQIEKYAGALQIPNIDQFTNVLVSEGLASRGNYQEAIDRLIKFYQANPISADRNMLSKRIVSYINRQLQSSVDSGDYIGALKFHQKYSDSWLKSTPQLTARMNVAKCLEFSGAPEAGEKFYRDVLNASLALNGTEESKILKANGTFPNFDEINLRLAAVNLQMGRNARSYEYIRQIKSPEKMSEKDQIERIEITSDLLEKRGDVDSAVRYLSELLKLWRGEAIKVAPLYLKLANLEEKLGRKADSIKSLEKVDQLYMLAKADDVDIHAKALLKLGEYLVADGKVDQAIGHYNKALEKYEDSKAMASVRYKVGELYFNRGELNKAEKAWSGFKGPNSDVWGKLAQEKMASLKWQEEYKKYLKRIPAMSGVE